MKLNNLYRIIPWFVLSSSWAHGVESVTIPIQNEKGIPTGFGFEYQLSTCMGGTLDSLADYESRLMYQVYMSVRGAPKFKSGSEQIRAVVKIDFDHKRVDVAGKVIHPVPFFPDGSGGTNDITMTLDTEWLDGRPQRTIVNQSRYINTTIGPWIRLAADTFIPYVTFESDEQELNGFGEPKPGIRRLKGLSIVAPSNYASPVNWVNIDNGFTMEAQISFPNYADCLEAALEGRAQ